MPEIRKDPDKNLQFYKEHKAEYRKLIKKANSRWKNIEAREYSSPAIEEAIESRKGTHYFTMEAFKNNPMQELQALRTFLADETSTVAGAKYYTDTVVRADVFTKEYGESWEFNPETGKRENNYGKHFSEVYGEDFTQRVYSNYRKVEYEYGGLLASHILAGTFDSDTLIKIMFSRAVESKKKHFSEENWERAPEFNFAMKTMEKYDRSIRERTSIFKNDGTRQATSLLTEGGEYFDYIGELYI